MAWGSFSISSRTTWRLAAVTTPGGSIPSNGGEELPFAAYFDINWDAARADLKGRVLLGVLGDQYGVILEQGGIELHLDPVEGSFSAWYFDHRFPISPRSYATILEAGGGPLAGLARDFAAIRSSAAVAARERAA